MARKKTNLLAGLPNEAVILSCESHASVDELHITFPDTAPACPDCGSTSCTRYRCLKHSAYFLTASKTNQKQLWGSSFQKRKNRLDSALQKNVD